MRFINGAEVVLEGAIAKSRTKDHEGFTEHHIIDPDSHHLEGTQGLAMSQKSDLSGVFVNLRVLWCARESLVDLAE